MKQNLLIKKRVNQIRKIHLHMRVRRIQLNATMRLIVARNYAICYSGTQLHDLYIVERLREIQLHSTTRDAYLYTLFTEIAQNCEKRCWCRFTAVL